MPVADYQCEACGVRWEEFHWTPPDMQECGCGGDAARIYSLPGERTAKRFDPIVVWVSNDDPDRISIPGDPNEPVDEGYHKVEITNLREADRWADRINRIETRKAEGYRDSERQYWDDVARERRADIRARIGSNPRAAALFSAVQKYVDAKRARRYGKPLDARAHFQVISFDSSNRDGYSGPDTDWRTRRK